jgi:hypothetical protein
MNFAKGIVRERTYKNKGEARYAQYLELCKRAGEILDYWYESIRLLVGESNESKNAWFNADFFVLCKDRTLEVREFKGRRMPAELMRLKSAAMRYPFRFVLVTTKGQNFKEEVI